MRETYFVFVVQCYEEKDADGRLLDFVETQVIASDIKSAEVKAAKIIKRKFYRTSMVIEKHYENT